MRTRNIGWMVAAVLALVTGALLASTNLIGFSMQQNRTGALLLLGYGAVVLWWQIRPLLSNPAARVAVWARRTRASLHA